MGTNIHLRFPSGISTEPVVCKLVRLFDLDFNITTAQISARREGFLILELLGSAGQCAKAVDYLRGRGVEVTPAALRMTPARRLRFDTEKCTVCTLCTRVCPVHALHVDSDA